MGDFGPVSGSESHQNWSETLGSVLELPTIREETEEELRDPSIAESGAPVDDGHEPLNQNFVRLSGPMVRIPLYRSLIREFPSSNPSGVPKVHCTPNPEPGVPKVHCTPTLGPGAPKVHCTPTLGAGIPKVHCTPTLAPGSLSTLVREEAEKKTETSIEHIRSKVLALENDISTHEVLFDVAGTAIDNQAQTLNSVTQRVSQTETFLEDINSKVSTLKYDVSVFRMLLDDEDKIENQAQTLDSVTQRLSQTETFLEDISSKVSNLEFDVSTVRKKLLDDEDKIENKTQTLFCDTKIAQTET